MILSLTKEEKNHAETMLKAVLDEINSPHVCLWYVKEKLTEVERVCKNADYRAKQESL